MVGVFIVGDSPQSQSFLAAAAQAGTQMVIVDSYCVTSSFDYRPYSDAAITAEYHDVMRERRESNSRNWKAVQRSHNFHQSKWTHNRPKHR